MRDSMEAKRQSGSKAVRTESESLVQTVKSAGVNEVCSWVLSVSCEWHTKEVSGDHTVVKASTKTGHTSSPFIHVLELLAQAGSLQSVGEGLTHHRGRRRGLLQHRAMTIMPIGHS